MTIKDVALLLLRDMGITSLVPSTTLDSTNTRGVGAGDLNAVAAAITGAYQELFEHAPATISERRMGGVLRGQVNVTLTANNFSTTISGLTTYASWMLGCTLRIAGDIGDNELLNTTTLVRPYMGTTGATTAQVWGDAIRLDPSVSHVLDPATIPNYWQMRMARDRVELLNTAAALPVRTPQTRPAGSGSLSLTKRTGIPECYMVEGQYEPATAYLPLYLRVAPMPSGDLPLEFRAKLLPPVVTAADIDGGDHTTDPNTIIPLSWVQAVLLPFARLRIASDPLFDNREGVKTIEREYHAARAILENQRPGIGRTLGDYQ